MQGQDGRGRELEGVHIHHRGVEHRAAQDGHRHDGRRHAVLAEQQHLVAGQPRHDIDCAGRTSARIRVRGAVGVGVSETGELRHLGVRDLLDLVRAPVRTVGEVDGGPEVVHEVAPVVVPEQRRAAAAVAARHVADLVDLDAHGRQVDGGVGRGVPVDREGGVR